MKRRQNIWPFGKGQPLGSKTTYRITRSARPVQERASYKGYKVWSALEGFKTSADPESSFDSLREVHRFIDFQQKNPGASGAAFKRCVASVAAKGSASDPRAVCAAAGRKKYGAKKYAAMAKAGKKRVAKRGRTNPSAEAAAVYQEFHGRPSSEVLTVTDRVHSHRNLAALGELVALVVNGVDGYEHTIKGFAGAVLASNERKNQLFIRGGDQEIDLSDYGISDGHEVETLGEVKEIRYHTTKDHLGSEGGTALYFHKTGTTNGANGCHKKVGYGPDLIYRVRDKALEFSGGTYTIKAEGIDK